MKAEELEKRAKDYCNKRGYTMGSNFTHSVCVMLMTEFAESLLQQREEGF